MHLVRRLRSAFWGAFQHGQFSIAKAGAYSSILTLFPAFLVITSLLEASHQTDVFIRQIAATVGWALPPEPRSLVMSFFHANHHQTNRILFSAFIVTLLAATGVMISWMEGFRKAYGIPNTWGFWKERARALYLVFLALLPMTLATVLVVFGNQIEALVQRDMHLLRPVVLFFWMLGRWAIAILTSITFTALIYHHGMPKTQSWRRILPGAIMATALWFPATMIFGWYVTHYATYTVVYGSLGAAIALLVWLYILSVIVLVGAEFNALVYPKTIENERAAKRV